MDKIPNPLFLALDSKVEALAASYDYLESPVSDGTIEENFEEELVDAPTGYDSLTYQYGDEDYDAFSDVAKYGIVEVFGDDTAGRRIIVVSACKLPPSKDLDHSKLLRYVFSICKHIYLICEW